MSDIGMANQRGFNLLSLTTKMRKEVSELLLRDMVDTEARLIVRIWVHGMGYSQLKEILKKYQREGATP